MSNSGSSSTFLLFSLTKRIQQNNILVSKLLPMLNSIKALTNLTDANGKVIDLDNNVYPQGKYVDAVTQGGSTSLFILYQIINYLNTMTNKQLGLLVSDSSTALNGGRPSYQFQLSVPISSTAYVNRTLFSLDLSYFFSELVPQWENISQTIAPPGYNLFKQIPVGWNYKWSKSVVTIGDESVGNLLSPVVVTGFPTILSKVQTDLNTYVLKSADTYTKLLNRVRQEMYRTGSKAAIGAWLADKSFAAGSTKDLIVAAYGTAVTSLITSSTVDFNVVLYTSIVNAVLADSSLNTAFSGSGTPTSVALDTNQKNNVKYAILDGFNDLQLFINITINTKSLNDAIDAFNLPANTPSASSVVGGTNLSTYLTGVTGVAYYISGSNDIKASAASGFNAIIQAAYTAAVAISANADVVIAIDSSSAVAASGLSDGVSKAKAISSAVDFLTRNAVWDVTVVKTAIANYPEIDTEAGRVLGIWINNTISTSSSVNQNMVNAYWATSAAIVASSGLITRDVSLNSARTVVKNLAITTSTSVNDIKTAITNAVLTQVITNVVNYYINGGTLPIGTTFTNVASIISSAKAAVIYTSSNTVIYSAVHDVVKGYLDQDSNSTNSLVATAYEEIATAAGLGAVYVLASFSSPYNPDALNTFSDSYFITNLLNLENNLQSFTYVLSDLQVN